MTRLAFLLLTSALALPAPAAAAAAGEATPPPAPRSTERWEILIQGNPAGEMTRRPVPAGAREEGAQVWTYVFNDRGRGPELETRLVLGEDGLPRSVATTGHDYFKTPVAERFSREVPGDGAGPEGVRARASWENADETGTRELAEPAFYLSAESAAPELALLARALRADADGRIPLLPEGEAVLAGTETLEVGSGGRRTRVTRLAISGLGFTPESVWLSEDGSFFASVGGWFTVVPEGREDVLETLREAEERADDAWARGLAERLAGRRSDRAVALVGAGLFDPRSGRVLPGRTIVVEGDRIAAVGPDGEVAVPPGAERIDASGKTVLFWGDEGIDTRTPARFTEVAARAAGLDLSSPEVERFVEGLAEEGIVVDPTVAIFESMFTARPGEVSPGYRAVADRFPPQVRRAFLGGGLQPPEGMEATYAASFRRMLEMVAKLHRAGVPLVAGTDGLAGFTLHRELELYAEAGIPAPEVLRIATLGAAEVAGRADRLGTVEPGKLADLIVVDGDPAEEISDVRRVELTMKGGTIYRAADLYEAVGIRPQPPM